MWKLNWETQYKFIISKKKKKRLIPSSFHERGPEVVPQQQLVPLPLDLGF